MKKILLTTILLLNLIPVKAQVLTVIDSLNRVLPTLQNSKERSVVYNELVGQWAEANFDSAYRYAKLMLIDARQFNDQTYQIKAFLALGVTHDYHNHLDSAKYYYGQAKWLSRQVNDIENEARADFNIATLEYAAGNYLTAIEVYRRTEQLFRKLKNERVLSRIYNNLGQVYLRSEQFASAIEAFDQSIELKKKLKDVKGELNTLTNLSIAYQKIGNFSEAFRVSKSTIALAYQLGDSLAYRNEFINLGKIFKEQKQYDSAFFYWHNAENLMRKDDPAPILGGLWINFADVYLIKKDFARALQYLQLASANYEIDPVLKLEYLQLQTRYYSGIGQFQTAFEYQQQVIEESKRQTGENVLKKLKEYETLFETEKKERQIVALEAEKRESELVLSQRARQRNVFIGAALILLLASTLIFYQYKQKQKANSSLSKALADREVLLKEIHHRVKNNLQIISSLLNLQAKSVKDQSAIDAVTESRNRVKSMSMIHEQLYQKDTLAGIRMPDYVLQLCTSLMNSYGVDRDRIELQLEVEELMLDVDTAIPMGLILNELVSNALKYAFPERREGHIRVSLKTAASTLSLTITDNGVGIQESKLFTSGFGLNLVTILSEKLQAEVSTTNSSGVATELLIKKYKVV